MHRLIAAAPLLLVAGCSLTPAADDPVQLELAALDERLARLERVLSNQSLVDLSQRVEALDAESRRQRGELELLGNGADGLRGQQRTLYADLERRLAALEGGAASPSGASGVPASGDAEQRAYDAAFDALKNARYDAAISGFTEFQRRYPDSALGDNAQYWLGEARYVTRDYDGAAAAFTAVGQRWPDSRKAPDALLKLGFAQYELKRLDAARRTLETVRTRYPGSDAARLAAERLQRISAERQ